MSIILQFCRSIRHHSIRMFPMPKALDKYINVHAYFFFVLWKVGKYSSGRLFLHDYIPQIASSANSPFQLMLVMALVHMPL